MPVDIFTRAQFESALPSDSISLGLDHGEYVYIVMVDKEIGIKVRSSISARGVSDGTGENSIRFYVVTKTENGWMFLGAENANKRWVTRVSGWQGRVAEQLDFYRKFVADLRERAGDCPRCKKSKIILKSHTPTNPDRLFAKCPECGNGFTWLS